MFCAKPVPAQRLWVHMCVIPILIKDIVTLESPTLCLFYSFCFPFYIIPRDLRVGVCWRYPILDQVLQNFSFSEHYPVVDLCVSFHLPLLEAFWMRAEWSTNIIMHHFIPMIKTIVFSYPLAHDLSSLIFSAIFFYLMEKALNPNREWLLACRTFAPLLHQHIFAHRSSYRPQG